MARGTGGQDPYTDPLTLKEALTRPDAIHWKQAADSELQQLQSTSTLKRVRQSSMPADSKLISSRMVFKKKLHPDGPIDKYRARLVARGFEQRYGIDYQATRSSTLAATSARVLLAIANFFGWPIFQMDIVGALLNASMGKTRLDLSLPDGFP